MSVYQSCSIQSLRGVHKFHTFRTGDKSESKTDKSNLYAQLPSRPLEENYVLDHLALLQSVFNQKLKLVSASCCSQSLYLSGFWTTGPTKRKK